VDGTGSPPASGARPTPAPTPLTAPSGTHDGTPAGTSATGPAAAAGPAAEPAADRPAIRLEALSKSYPDGTVAVGALDLDVARGEIVCLVGPSGCGKSTTLRMVNRLIEPTAGRVILDGDDVTASDPVQLRRRIGYVIQSGGLLPHRTVAENVATVPKLLGWDRTRTRARVHDLLTLVGLDPATYGGRYPAALSGGQQQRVGVARALAADPPVLLMDEPFGAVDPVVRLRLQREFRAIQAELGTTVLFVTHDLDEAVALGHRIAVLSAGGHLEQYAEPAAVLGSPATEFVADFVGGDRGVRRLAVTPLRSATLSTPATVRTGDRPSFASARLSSVGARWAVVLDPGGRATGWVSAQDLVDGAAETSLGPLARPLPGTADLDRSTLSVLSQALLVPEGWVAVLDGDRYVGVFDRAGVPDVRTDTAAAGPVRPVVPVTERPGGGAHPLRRG